MFLPPRPRFTNLLFPVLILRLLLPLLFPVLLRGFDILRLRRRLRVRENWSVLRFLLTGAGGGVSRPAGAGRAKARSRKLPAIG